ncbi:MAG: hypothetical protein AB1609_09400 [Bacillota bacterium]
MDWCKLNRGIELRDALPFGRSAAGAAGAEPAVQQPHDGHTLAFITCLNDETQYPTCLGMPTRGSGAGGEAKAIGDGGKEVRLAIGYGGPWVGYQRELVGKFWVQAGVGVAFGGATLTVYTAQDSGTFDTAAANQVTYTRFIFGLLPELTVAWSLTPFMHLQAGVASGV